MPAARSNLTTSAKRPASSLSNERLKKAKLDTIISEDNLDMQEHDIDTPVSGIHPLNAEALDSAIPVTSVGEVGVAAPAIPEGTTLLDDKGKEDAAAIAKIGGLPYGLKPVEVINFGDLYAMVYDHLSKAAQRRIDGFASLTSGKTYVNASQTQPKLYSRLTPTLPRKLSYIGRHGEQRTTLSPTTFYIVGEVLRSSLLQFDPDASETIGDFYRILLAPYTKDGYWDRTTALFACINHHSPTIHLSTWNGGISFSTRLPRGSGGGGSSSTSNRTQVHPTLHTSSIAGNGRSTKSSDQASLITLPSDKNTPVRIYDGTKSKFTIPEVRNLAEMNSDMLPGDIAMVFYTVSFYQATRMNAPEYTSLNVRFAVKLADGPEGEAAIEEADDKVSAEGEADNFTAL